MAISSLPLFFLFSILMISSIKNFDQVHGKCLHDEKTLLLKLRSELNFNSSHSLKLVSWNHTNDCCSWEGVDCDYAGHVITLQLDDDAISGELKPSSSLFGLRYLETLSLSHNLLNGTFQLEKIHNLPNLAFLDLSYNNFSVDATNMSSSSSSSSYRFPQLSNLLLASCNLHGFLLGNSSAFTQLQVLDLSSCNLQEFPYFIKQSPLTYLDLSRNQIAGEIPSWIWEIGNGTLFRLNLSCNMLVDLQKPYHIPASLWMLDLHSNMLRGELPLTPSGYVDYSNNILDKSIPPDIGNVPRRYLSLSNNSLTGAIPSSLCNATYLLVLDLSYNGFTGDIPRCLLQNMSQLGVLNLESNKIIGHIPDRFPVNCSLQTFDLSNNKLQGSIPKSLGYCKQLQVMNVGGNYLNDSFPCMLPESLRLLVLRSNRFHGEIKCSKSWPNLQIIDIASNNFSGSLHGVNFSSWRAMMLSNVELKQNHLGFTKYNYLPNYYLDEVTLVVKGLGLKLAKIRADFTAIDFSCNHFDGEILDEVGDLRSLYLLNLSYNSFSGAIPKSFGNLTELGSLDLSTNKLTGTIPEELARLTFLSVLNLSYNKLVGVIPKGRQIQTFSADSFQGKSGLCGFPINISCMNTNENNLSPPDNENVESKREIKWGYVIAALGYVVGLGSIVWLLLFCRSFRKKYLDKIDEVVEDIFHTRDMRRRRRASASARTRLVRNQAQAVRRRQ